MDFWDKNLDALRVLQRYFVNNLEEIHEAGEDIVELGDVIDISEAKDGNPVLVINKGGKANYMNSRFRPIGEAEKYAAQFDDIKDYSVGLFFGFGNGTFAREIVKKGSDKVRYCFFEPCKESFLYCLHNCDLTDILADHRVTIYVEGINKDETGAYLPNYIEWANIPLTEIYVLPKYSDLFISEYRDFVKVVRDIIARAQMAQNTMVTFGGSIMRNAIMRLQFMYNAVNSVAFNNYFPKDMPAVLVSAGPSLAKNVHLLKEYKGRVFIMCVDTAYRKLVREGIAPDVVISVDPKKGWIMKDFDQYEDISGESAFITCTIGNVKLNGNLNFYRSIYFNGDDQYIQHLCKELGNQSLGGYATGGSVACSAFSMLEAWGFQTIIFIGQDLAFTGGRRYSLKAGPGSMDKVKEDSEKKGFTLFEVDGYYGDKVMTREDYYTYLKWFESAVYITDATNLINSTEGGAMINGMVNMPFAEALEKYATKEVYDIKDMIMKAPYIIPEDKYEKLDDIILKLPTRAKYFMRRFKEGVALAERGLTLIKRGNYDHNELAKISKELDKIDKDTSHEPEFILISNRAVDVQNRVQREQIINGVNMDTVEEQKQVFASLILLYRAFYDASGEMKEFADELVNSFNEEGRK